MGILNFSVGISLLILGVSTLWGVPKIDTTSERVKTKVLVPYQRIGTLIPKNVAQTKNNLTVGCETLDRDYADYDAYKEYLVPLGFKKIRLQGGWAKTEKVKGVYDFTWLDHIIDDARTRGLTVWLQTSYGNPIYKGGGTPFLKGGMPNSPEGIAAWDNWVDAMAKRYAGKVEWEMWNEPDINRNTTKLATVENNIRTAEIIRKHDPNAKIAALALARLGAKHLEEYLKIFKEKDKLDIFNWISYHGYEYRPERSYEDVEAMRDVLKKYSDKVILRQGENGAPSKGFMGGALKDHPWTELTQGKWDMRRMLGDWGRGIDTSVFSISDMRYDGNDAIKILNVKGLLATDENNKIIKIKKAYYILQNFASVFDLLDTRKGKIVVNEGYIETICAFAFTDSETKMPTFALWFGDNIPSNMNATNPIDVMLKSGGKIKNPVWVDILTGGVYKIPQADISRRGEVLYIKNLPLYDSPIIIVDKSLVDFVEQ